MKIALTIGAVIRDTYTVLDKLGEGAFSEVFLVRHKFLGLQAMKVFKKVSLTPDYDQFREAFVLSKIAHPNVVRIFEANKLPASEGDRSYLTMEYVQGGTLDSYLNEQGPLSVGQAVDIQRQLCAGLSTAHSQDPPIIHRDIKPLNVLISVSGKNVQAKVADFGLARNIDPKLRMASAAGTLLYMPPEGFRHYGTPASDVYSAGLIFYQLLTGQFPFPPVSFDSEQEFRLKLAKSRSSVPPAPSLIKRDVPAVWDRVCMKALQPNIKERYQSALKFLAALEAAEAEVNRELAAGSGSSGQAANHKGSVETLVVEKPNTRPMAEMDLSENATGQETARELLDKALVLGRQYADLPVAIALLEQAIEQEPRLADKYGGILTKWKSGIIL